MYVYGVQCMDSSGVFGLVGARKLGSLWQPLGIPSRQGALCDAMSRDFHINCKMWTLFQVIRFYFQ